MRNSLFVGMALLVMLLGSCKQSVNIGIKTDKSVEKSENWEINITKSVLSSENPQAEQACQAVNAKIQYLIDSLQQNLKTEADTFFMEFAQDTANRPAFNYELYVGDTVFLADEAYISVRMLVYSYTGGAHGMNDFYALNYDVKNRAFVAPNEILDLTQESKINDLLARNFKNEEGCFTDKPTLTSGFTAFNITPTAVCFTYPQYVLGPYVCGYAQVFIPKSELKGLFKK